jgi:SH3-like domain-containing protein
MIPPRRLLLRGLLFAATLALACPVGAQTPEVAFERGLQRPAEGAASARAKLVVLEFQDPQKTGLGRGVAALVYKDMLTAMGVQADAVVVHPAAPVGQRLAELVERDHHRAALRIAAENQGRVVIWGRIQALGDVLVIHTAVSMPSAVEDPELVLQIAVGGKRVQDVAAEIGWTRFDFAPVAIRRTQFFDRLAVAGSSGVQLRAAPESSAAVMRTVRPGEVLNLRDMREAWYVVADGTRSLFVDASPRQNIATGFQILPRRLAVAVEEVARGDANERAATLAKLEPQRTYAVLARRVPADGRPWYQIDTGGRRGWVPQSQTTGILDLAAQNFALAAHHTLGGDVRGAERELRRFLMRPESERSSAVTAAALQLLGTMLIRAPAATRPQREAALALLDRSVEETPFDPSALNLRAVARLGVSGGSATLDDLEAALALDPLNGRTRILAAALKRASDHGGDAAIAALGLRDPEFLRRLDAIMLRLSGRGARPQEPRRIIEDMRRIFEPPRR